MTTRPTPSRETPTRERTDVELERLYHLILLDDDQHTYDYVIEMLASIFGYATEKAFALARMVDSQGRVILETASRDRCERHQSRIHAYGADPRIPTSKGSMSAIVDEAF
ncbi:MAG: ATP-dependent Clp protease adaptor ClpS [Chloroflexi bacterium]|nr:ATP-dependent Clp protease adaptor ClpS [Chloroflexota bacterium]MDA1004127.1 ATP-dependent Clp protease adaptor ClpS [Chloroflexota bacterium]